APAGEADKLDPVAGYDAQCVKVVVPKEILTDEVFRAVIVMRNTGTQSWGPENDRHAYLRSQTPLDNNTWGCNFIIQGQGTNVPPGGEFTYASYLKAPGTPGEHVFQWRLARGTSLEHDKGKMFGAMTPAETIVVKKRPDEPAPPPRPRESLGKRLLTFDDFEYAGSFVTPTIRGEGSDWSGPIWSFAGLALRTLPDGTRRLMVNYTHLSRNLIEVEIPELMRWTKDNYQALKVAKVTKTWGPLGTPWEGDKNYGADGGIWWDEAHKTLYWSSWHPYWCGPPYPVLGASKLGDDGKVTELGRWFAPSDYCKAYWGGVTALPKAFADTYTGGRTLAIGFGGGYSGGSNCSRGPAVAAVATPDPAKDKLDMVEMLGYFKGDRAPRDGNYFVAPGPANGYWGEPPEGPTKGYWCAGDGIGNGIYLDLPDRHGFIAFAVWTIGRKGYDYADSVAHVGDRAPVLTQCWYFYDPKDLGEAARKLRKVNLAPYAMTRVSAPGGNLNGGITGSCFDAQKRLLYLYYRPHLHDKPAIHVYSVKGD
ncbi:MAG TPA: hypothetical protein VM389_06775, partial [Phycisphaerae bacterium]|nr:hypothetical protein [Phycisphaerae bacterium]